MKKTLLGTILFISLIAKSQSYPIPFDFKNKQGYMNTEGKIILPPIYDYADNFINGVAVVAIRNQPCVINTNGTRIIDTGLYQSISRFENGLAAATDYDNHKFYITLKGYKAITLADSIYEARPFSEGVAVIAIKLDEHETKFNHDIATLGYRFAFIDTTGKLLTHFIFEDADDIHAGLARVRQGFKFGLVNTKGELILKPTYYNIGLFSNGLAVADENGKYGFINQKGELVIKPIFDYAYNFSGGLAGFYNKGKHGYIDSTGTIIIPAQFDQIKPFAEGKAAVLLNGKWGFIDQTGTLVLRNVFDNASVFSEGKCAVLIKRNWGFIDTRGSLIIPAEFDAAGSFSNGVADVVYHDINLYINATGTLLPIVEKK
jgi:hypothetical protein